MSIITLNVNTTFDENDGTNSGNGLSLRDAIIKANKDVNNDYVITLQSGETYYLTVGVGDDTAALGDLDILGGANITITTAGNTPATIDASPIGDRAFHVFTNGTVLDKDGTLTLDKVIVTGGLASLGGGIYSDGILIINNSTISDNLNTNVDWTLGGGGIYSGGTLIINNSTISDNLSYSSAGGICNRGTLTITNSTISSNSAHRNGGGLSNISNNPTIIINTTITNNTADATNANAGSGGGIYNHADWNWYTPILLKNSIVAGNFDTPNNIGPGNIYRDLNGNFTGSTYNLIGNSSGVSSTVSPTNIILPTNQSAGLGPLQNNGGVTQTHALLTGSPAINAGLNVLIGPDYADSDGDGNTTEFTPYDQRGAGFVRISGSSVDLGAFEVQSTALPTLAINDVTITEGNSGTTNAVFTVTRTGTATNTITVNYATADGTSNPATAGSDYTTTNGTLSFATNETTKTITVPIIGDTTVEPNETFFVNLSSATNATLADAQGLGTITNDDTAALPTLAINDVTITEGNSGTTNATFTVTRTGTATGVITVNYATADGTTNPATAGSDYTATNGTLTFATNETSKTFTVPIIGDTTVESNETFFVNLSSATNATITDAQGLGTINDDDTAALPTLAINDVTLTEGNSGTTNATFTVTRTGTATGVITVNYATANDTATAGSDYTATTGTLTFATNETSKTITVAINGDTTVESNETFFVNLSSATNATLADAQGLGTINDDDNTTSGILLIGDDDDNYLIGGSGNDTLQGLGGNDTLNGATGVDSLVGGLGNDIYYVDNSGDIVVEASNAGTDIVNTNITYTLPANVENLAMIDSGNVNDNINATGNTLNNKLTGNSGANTLTGDTGNDSLNGGKGNDTLNGGAGNDTYTVESLNDVIIDSAGVDLVKSSVSWTLATGLENLTLIGSTAINGTGNSVNNIIIGNTGVNTLTGLDGNDSLNGDAGNDTLLGGNGNDTLVGGVGSDSLTGGSGLDFFRFNAKTEGIDTISDFVVVDDTIQVAKSSFAGGLVVGTLLTTQFTLGASATTTAHRFGYESGTGKLWFDVDGNGATGATQIATLPTGLGLTNADIVVF